MSKAVVAAIAGTVATAAIAGGAIIGYQQLSKNSTTNSNVSVQQAETTTANSNVEKAQTLKDKLIGTWIDVDDPTHKAVFTPDEMTQFTEQRNATAKYEFKSDSEITLSFGDETMTVNVSIEDDLLTMEVGDKKVKYKRESADAANSNANANTSVLPTNSAANANNQTSNTAANTATAPKEEVPLTQEAKVFKNTLVGTWKLLNYPNEVTFTEDKYEVKQGYIFLDTGSYRVLDEKTVEINSDQKNRKWNATMKVKDGGNRIDWEQQEPGETKQKIELERVNPK